MTKTNKFDKVHLSNLRKIEKKVEAIYLAAAKDAAAIAASVKDDIDAAVTFSFSDYPLARRRFDKLLETLNKDVTAVIVNGVQSEWTLANNKNNELCRQVFGDALPHLSKSQQRKYFSTNPKAEEAFLQRKESGLKLSDRVWNYSNLFRNEIELGVDLGIRGGQSAADMGRDLKQYLRHPDMLFRRVKNERGELVLSKNAAAYHPGRGVYRSSYKNALRLAATECNMAYRTADYLRWQDEDFVVGIRIQTSQTNHLVSDICDLLKGDYPKDFKFVGWHSWCRCYATPILKTKEEIIEDNRRIMEGKPLSNDSVNKVNDVPEKFKKWLVNNEERVKYQTSIPYFLKDNIKYVPNGFIESFGSLYRGGDNSIISDVRDILMKIKDPDYITEKDVKNIIKDFADKNPSLFNGGLIGVKITGAKSYDAFMSCSRSYIRATGAYSGKGNELTISKRDIMTASGVIFNPYKELQSAIRTIREGRRLTFNEEYSIESLWHEIRHATAVGWKDIGKKTKEIAEVMEIVNQFCARRSYGKLIKALGGKQSNMKSIIENGYGYEIRVRNFSTLLKKCNISQSSAYAHFKNRIINTPYENIRGDMIDFLIDRGGLNRKTAEELIKGLQLSKGAFDALIKGV